MILKKINAVISLLMTLLVVDHITACSIHLITHQTQLSSPTPARLLATLAIVHMGISLWIVFARHDAVAPKYYQKNQRTYQQRIFGVLILALLPYHVISSMTAAKGDISLAFLIVHVLFTVVVTGHVATSVPGALVSLGLLSSQKQHKIALLISNIVCVLLLLLAVAGSIVGGME